MTLALLTFDLDAGGAERVMATLANGFVRAGHTTDLVCVRAAGPFLREVDATVRIVDLGMRKTMFAALPLARYLRQRRPDALLSTLANVNVAAAAARLLSGGRVRFVARETTHASTDNRTLAAGEFSPMAVLRRWAYARADRVVAPSQGVAEDLAAHVGVTADRISVIANPVDLGRIDELAQDPAPHLEALPAGTRIVLAVGRLAAEKDLPTLLRAFARLRDRGSLALVLLGEGDHRALLAGLARQLGIADAVLMPGFVPNPFAYLKRADVFVLSSRYEGLPNTLIQALATGTPAVATDCPSGPREILEHGRWGRLVPVGDDLAMAAAIEDGLAGRIATPPRVSVAERFGLDAVIARYHEVLRPQ